MITSRREIDLPFPSRSEDVKSEVTPTIFIMLKLYMEVHCIVMYLLVSDEPPKVALIEGRLQNLEFKRGFKEVQKNTRTGGKTYITRIDACIEIFDKNVARLDWRFERHSYNLCRSSEVIT